jgi:hypothetical protein
MYLTEAEKNELHQAANYLGGYIVHDENEELPFIRVDTGDYSSKENYDDLISDSNEIKKLTPSFKIKELFADHDTQIVEFEKRGD